MKRIVFCIFLLIYPNFVLASDSGIQYNLRQIHENYADSYLTYQGALKVWYGNTLSKLGIKLPKGLEQYVKGRWAFQSSVNFYSILADSDTLNLDLSPTEFKALFNYEVEKQLGENVLKELNLDIHKKYLAPGE